MIQKCFMYTLYNGVKRANLKTVLKHTVTLFILRETQKLIPSQLTWG